MSCAAPTKPMGSLFFRDVKGAEDNLFGELTPDFIWKTIPNSLGYSNVDIKQMNFLTTFGLKI